MAWRDNPVGIVLDGTKTADLKKLKAEGLSFVVIDGATGPDRRNPAISSIVQDAYDNNLPVIMMFTPYPDQENYTLDGNVKSQLPLAKSITANHLIHAFLVSVDRYWTGTDYEEYQAGTRKQTDVRWSTNANISNTAKEIVNSMVKFFGDQSKTTPVLVRTSDGFVQSYSKDLAAWVGLFPFYLADWRYRIQNPDDGGQYNKYVIYSATATPVETLAALRAQMPPAEAKNPLVPGAGTMLKFWEFSGRRFVHPAVKDLSGKPTTASWVLFNGTVDALNLFLKFSPHVEEPADTTPPGVPSNLIATLSGSDVTVSWQSPVDADVAGYTVYRNGSTIVTAPERTYVDRGLVPGSYGYSVDAVDKAGNRSVKTAPVTVVVPVPQDPGDPPVDTGTFIPRLKVAITAFARAWLDFEE